MAKQQNPVIELPIVKAVDMYPVLSALTGWFQQRIMDNMPSVDMFVGGDYLSRAVRNVNTRSVPLIFTKNKDRDAALEYFVNQHKGTTPVRHELGKTTKATFKYIANGWSIDLPVDLLVHNEICTSFKQCFENVPALTCTSAFYDGKTIAMLDSFMGDNTKRVLNPGKHLMGGIQWLCTKLIELGGEGFKASELMLEHFKELDKNYA